MLLTTYSGLPSWLVAHSSQSKAPHKRRLSLAWGGRPWTMEGRSQTTYRHWNRHTRSQVTVDAYCPSHVLEDERTDGDGSRYARSAHKLHLQERRRLQRSQAYILQCPVSLWVTSRFLRLSYNVIVAFCFSGWFGHGLTWRRRLCSERLAWSHSQT